MDNYRVFGYDDMCVEFDVPFESIVDAARCYLNLARNGMVVVFFMNELNPNSKTSDYLTKLGRM